MEKKPNVGGQAVIEGVMMRGKDKIAVAVRQPDGEIAIDVGPANSITDKYPFLKKPLLRGVVALCESLYHGMKALAYSAQVSGEDDEQLDSKEMAMTIAFSIVLAVVLFIIIPTWSMRFLNAWTHDFEFSRGRIEDADFSRIYNCYFFDEGYSESVSVPWC